MTTSRRGVGGKKGGPRRRSHAAAPPPLRGPQEHLFTADDWQQHSSVGRFWRHVQTIPTSRTVARVLQPTLFCLAQTTAVCAYDGLRPDGWPALPPVSDAFFSLTGPALALLLVFRTDASYGRWNDARKTLGELIFKSRNLQRQFYTCLPGRQHAALRCQLASWLVAFSAALKLHLRASGGGYGDGGAALRNELAGGWLGDAALDSLAAARHGPNAALAVVRRRWERHTGAEGGGANAAHPPRRRRRPQLSHVVRRAPAADLGALDDNLTHFAEVVGRCERIQRVPSARAEGGPPSWVKGQGKGTADDRAALVPPSPPPSPAVVHAPHVPLPHGLAVGAAVLPVHRRWLGRTRVRAPLLLPALRRGPDRRRPGEPVRGAAAGAPARAGGCARAR